MAPSAPERRVQRLATAEVGHGLGAGARGDVPVVADLDMANSMVFEGAPQRARNVGGIKDFADAASRNERRKLVMDFWQD